MSKFYGKLGYVKTTETVPGVYKPVVTEKMYAGDILKADKKWNQSDNLNDDINLSMRIGIVTDHFANQNIGNLKYVEYLGSKWKVTKVDLSLPRQILSIGGVYNGE